MVLRISPTSPATPRYLHGAGFLAAACQRGPARHTVTPGRRAGIAERPGGVLAPMAACRANSRAWPRRRPSGRRLVSRDAPQVDVTVSAAAGGQGSTVGAAKGGIRQNR